MKSGCTRPPFSERTKANKANRMFHTPEQISDEFTENKQPLTADPDAIFREIMSIYHFHSSVNRGEKQGRVRTKIKPQEIFNPPSRHQMISGVAYQTCLAVPTV